MSVVTAFSQPFRSQSLRKSGGPWGLDARNLDMTVQPPARPSRLLFWGDRNPFPLKRWIVSGFLAEGEIVGLIGDPFAGKSIFAAALSGAVAGGGEFFGQQVATGSVIYVAAERARVTWSRLGVFGEDLRLALWRGPIRLGERRDVTELIEAIGETADRFQRPTRLVVVDTLSRCAAGLDENSASDASLLVEALQSIADAGPAVLVLHHTAKGDPRSVRGSTVLTGAFDAVARITVKGERRIARLTETNDGEPGATFEFEIQALNNDGGSAVPHLVPLNRPRQAEPTRPPMGLDGADGGPVASRQKAIVAHVMASGGKMARSGLLAKLREAGELPMNASSASELLRQALKASRERGAIEFDKSSIWLMDKAKSQSPKPP